MKIKVSLGKFKVESAAVSTGLSHQFFTELQANSTFFRNEWCINDWASLEFPRRSTNEEESRLIDGVIYALVKLGWKPTTATNNEWNFARNGGWPLRLRRLGTISLTLLGDQVEPNFPGERLVQRALIAAGFSLNKLDTGKPHGVLFDIWRTPKAVPKSIATLIKNVIVKDQAKNGARYGLLPWNDVSKVRVTSQDGERFTVRLGKVLYTVSIFNNDLLHVLGDYTAEATRNSISISKAKARDDKS